MLSRMLEMNANQKYVIYLLISFCYPMYQLQPYNPITTEEIHVHLTWSCAESTYIRCEIRSDFDDP
jgi:hypothetical protein